MRASEFISESTVANYLAGKFRVLVAQHFFDRMKQRNVSQEHVQQLLKDIIEVSEKIDDLYPGQQFYVVDRDTKISLGFSKVKDEVIKLNTVVATDNPITRSDHAVLKI